ncbi:lysylphosphatidylglycerol synthase transmembrane domain-containing protein [Propionivibrio soli]|uniref:lysylphosphatidylglycerol synthase transmembrane domain-containing protein n=1 Tax=Propionivibrio soli TaxID=2976531 RepID=UPI0021E854D5|nr:lysylphosphatidylglycerol synthase transmembrane domain-containing protein [Propionivibrio soli]
MPPLILYLIFRRIDLGELRQLASSANIFFVFFGIVMVIPTVVIGAFRWHLLMQRCDTAFLTLKESTGEYWKSLAIGFLVPGSLGSDTYRVMIVGRQNGRYLRNAVVIVLEKLAALASCALLLGILYPLLAPNALPPLVADIVNGLYVVLVVGCLATLTVFALRRQVLAARVARALSRRLLALARRAARSGVADSGQDEANGTVGELLRRVFSPRVILPALGLSLAVHVVASTQSQILFQAFTFEIPFSVNLFVTPLLVLLYSLPISFGGIGVREGASILAYGAFGVPVEIALVVSFCALLANLLTYGIGAAIFFFTRPAEAPA